MKNKKIDWRKLKREYQAQLPGWKVSYRKGRFRLESPTEFIKADFIIKDFKIKP